MQVNFIRHEKKYLVTKEQAEVFKGILSQYMKPDKHGEYLVQNIYFDNENWDVIRTSIEKPLYKEKMRLRCYGIPNKESRVFLELKKKYKGMVYKRRDVITHDDLLFNSALEITTQERSQIFRELNFYMRKTQVTEKIYIAYKRTAFNGIEHKDLRVTFDADICFRLDNLDFLDPNYGTLLLPKDKIVMEIKTLGGMPVWMAQALSEHKIYPAPFSKYGRCYTGFILKQPDIRTKINPQIIMEGKLSA